MTQYSFTGQSTSIVAERNQETWHELETRIARPKFDRYFGDSGRSRRLVKIAQSIRRFEASAAVSVSRDNTDDKFIEPAIDSGATILISGDPDLMGVTA